jgi:hypothetical protein
MLEARRRQAVARLQEDREWASSTGGQQPAGTAGGETGKTQVPRKKKDLGGGGGNNWGKNKGCRKGKEGDEAWESRR